MMKGGIWETPIFGIKLRANNFGMNCRDFFSGLILFGLMVCLNTNLVAQQRPPAVPPAQKEDSTQSKRVKIIHASILSYLKENDTSFEKLVGRVELKQDSTYFFCDSAYFFESSNLLEAYSKVRIEMADSLFLFGDRLTYDTDTKVSEVYNNISLTNQDVVLTTDRMTFYREENYGFYKDGGKMVDDDNVLTSILGYYYPNEDMAYFRDSVKLVSPDYTLTTDTLGYNTETKVSYFLTETYIVSEDGEIKTKDGFYDTENGVVSLYSRSTVKDSSYVLVADTIIYYEKRDYGFARGDVLVFQDDSSLQIHGGLAQFNRKTDESWVTRNAIAVHTFKDDTLYVWADTLFSVKEYELVKKEFPVEGNATSVETPDSLISDSVLTDSSLTDSLTTSLDSVVLQQPQPDSVTVIVKADSTLKDTSVTVVTVDSIMQNTDPGIFPPNPNESDGQVGPAAQAWRDSAYVVDSLEIRLIKAYKNVKFFMDKMQGRADSMVYFYDDSVMYLYGNPVLWSEESQLTGDTIVIWMKNEKADSMWVGRNAFLASREDTVGFNQIKGKELRAKFKDDELYRVHVIGNSESIYFAKNDDDTTNIYYEGMNKALAQEMIMYFEENEVKKIIFLTNPEGTYYPFFKVVLEQNELDGMRWRIEEKPDEPELFRQADTVQRRPSTPLITEPESETDIEGTPENSPAEKALEGSTQQSGTLPEPLPGQKR